jgi:microcystin-dependent protein
MIYLGDIRMFAGDFAPDGWALCDGSALSIDQNNNLFNLIGRTYGGDQTTFNVPDLRFRVPIHQGQGPGLSQNYAIGTQGGVESVTLSLQQMPAHTHVMAASDKNGQQPQPTNAFLAQTNPGFPYVAPFDTASQLQSDSLSSVGGGLEHDNVAPSLTISFIIALTGTFPQP